MTHRVAGALERLPSASDAALCHLRLHAAAAAAAVNCQVQLLQLQLSSDMQQHHLQAGGAGRGARQ